MIRRLRQFLFPPPSSGGWAEIKRCETRLNTFSAEHVCGERGPHYQHTCENQNCRFRWA